MRRPPKIAEFYRYPVVAGTALIATGVTLASWTHSFDISPLLENAMVRHGEIWRLVTSMFPHVDPLHLIFNIYWFWVFGTLVEEVYGHAKTAALILLFAFGSGAFEFAFSTGGVGLSGVGYGLFGLLWVLSKRDERFRDAIDARTIQLFVFWFFLCIALTAANVLPVGNVAHGAGAVLGILTGFAITMAELRASISVGITGVLALGLWAATLGRPVVNLSKYAGNDEGLRGDEALRDHRDQEAVRWLRESVAYRHQERFFWFDLGIAYERAGNKPEALTAFKKATAGDDAEAQYFRGLMYTDGYGDVQKDDAQAVAWYRKAADQGLPSAQNSVAWAYATSSDPAIRNPELALKYARKAVEAETDHPNPGHLDTLAEAYYVNQRYEEAVQAEKQALQLASPEFISSEDKKDLEKRLEKYQLAVKDNAHSANSKPPGN
jgi:membrane associated rhomboid family serine protease